MQSGCDLDYRTRNVRGILTHTGTGANVLSSEVTPDVDPIMPGDSS